MGNRTAKTDWVGCVYKNPRTPRVCHKSTTGLVSVSATHTTEKPKTGVKLMTDYDAVKLQKLILKRRRALGLTPSRWRMA